MRCDKCRWWEPLEYPHRGPDMDGWATGLYGTEPPEDAKAHPWGECLRVSTHQVGWRLFNFEPEEERPHGSSKFVVHDASHYGADLTTRADFGCVEYEDAT